MPKGRLLVRRPTSTGKWPPHYCRIERLYPEYSCDRRMLKEQAETEAQVLHKSFDCGHPSVECQQNGPTRLAAKKVELGFPVAIMDLVARRFIPCCPELSSLRLPEGLFINLCALQHRQSSLA